MKVKQCTGDDGRNASRRISSGETFIAPGVNWKSRIGLIVRQIVYRRSCRRCGAPLEQVDELGIG